MNNIANNELTDKEYQLKMLLNHRKAGTPEFVEEIKNLKTFLKEQAQSECAKEHRDLTID